MHVHLAADAAQVKQPVDEGTWQACRLFKTHLRILCILSHRASILCVQVEAVKKRQKEEQEKGIPHLMLH